MPQIDPAKPCPCESGKAAQTCCFFGGEAQPREADTRPKPPRTGYAHPKCYAAALNDCSQEITGEHYLSENLLRELSAPTVKVRGLPWQKTEVQRVGVANMKANILCGRHNSVLSPLDTQLGRLFRNVRSASKSLEAGDGAKSVYLFPGIDIERALLKVLMGMCSAGVARTPGGEPLPWTPPEQWLRVLFGEWDFRRSWGLYVDGRVGATKGNNDEWLVGVAPLSTETGVSGLVAVMGPIELVLATRDVPVRREGALDEHSVYRPGEIKLDDPPSGTTHSICFAWNGRGPYTTQVQFLWNRTTT